MWFLSDFTLRRPNKSKADNLRRDRNDRPVVIELDDEDDSLASRVSLPGLPRGAKRIPCETCKGHLGCKIILDPPTASTVNGLQRLTYFLTCFGLLYTKRRSERTSYSMLYSIFVCFICMANFLRFFAVYETKEEYGSKLFLKIILHVWYGQLASVTLIYFFHVSKHLRTLLTKWNEYVFRYQCETGEYLKIIGDRFILGVSLVVFVLGATTFVAYVYEREGIDESAIGVDKIIPTFTKNSIIPRICYAIFNVFICFLWVLPTALEFTICSGLTLNFKNVHQLLTKRAKGVAVVSDKELEKFRFQHQKLCRLTKQTDNVFALFNLTVFGTSIPLLCLFIYTFAFHAFDGREFAITLCAMHILLIAVQMGMVTGAASALNRQATAPKEELFEMEMDPANEDAQSRAIQVTLFMHRLTNDHIGLTAWNLLNINKKTILTVTTMILSYVFVLIKFGLTLEYEGDSPLVLHHPKMHTDSLNITPTTLATP